MIKYVLLENENTLETYEKVILAYSDEQAMKQIPTEYIDEYTVISIRTYELQRFLQDNAIIKGMINKMEITIEGVADFKGIYEEWHKAIELLTSLDLTLEEEWQEFGVEERVIRYANIQSIYERLLRCMINE